MTGMCSRRHVGIVLTLALVPALLAAPVARAGDGCSMLGLPASITSDDAGRVPACTPETVTVVRVTDADLSAAIAAAVSAVAARTDAIDLGGLLAHGAAPAPKAKASSAPTAPTPPAAPRAPSASRTAHRAGRHATREGRTTTDTTLVVRRGTKLELHNFGGEIAIATWPREAVRIQAEHSRRDWVEVRNREGVLRVESQSRMGPANAVEFRVTLPAWMPIQLTGVYNDVTADGVQGGISVETVRGDIAVRRASGAIELRSVEGLVDLSDAKGTIMVSSVNDAVRLMNVAGTIQAEAVNGDIQLLDLTSNNVEATTVNGAVLFDGKMFDGGSYRFATHSGDIAMGMNARSNATVTVSTYAGDFEAPFPIRLSRKDKGKRFEFVLGTGKADVELESFQGAIQLFSPGDKEMLRRFADTWRESEKGREYKWIMNGESKYEWSDDADDDDDDDDDDDEDDETPPPPPHKKGK